MTASCVPSSANRFTSPPIRSERADDPRFHALLFAYFDDLARMRAHLPRLVGSGDVTAVVRCAHRLSGTAAAYGFPQLGEKAAAVERAVAARGLCSAWGDLDALERALDAALAGAPTLMTDAA
jgi:HPt (histidine-containing phosphotransfer) domain-containing protein